MTAARLPAPLSLPRLRFMTCGAVDEGKSTLIGRLLYDSGAVFEDHAAEARRNTHDGALDFSFLVDGLKAEREQGITIDVAYRYFATARRSFLIADAPGHEQYTCNQAAAASQTQLAIALVSAGAGIPEQTRRHLAIASMFGVRDVIVAVNKMDLVGWRQEAFDAIREAFVDLAKVLDLRVAAIVPICAPNGENVAKPGAAAAWYDGPTLLDLLEGFEPPAADEGTALLPVALTGRLDGGGRVSFGEIAAGRIAVGQTLRTDTRLEATVTRLWVAGAERKEAGRGEAVAIELAPEVDLGRGAVLAAGDHSVGPTTQLRIRFVWLAREAMQPGETYEIEIGKSCSSATLLRIEQKLDLSELAMKPIERSLEVNDIAVARLKVNPPLPALAFDESRQLGSFILIDRLRNRTVAAGIVLSIDRVKEDTPWQYMQVTSEDRARAMGQTPKVVWLTGLSGAGKSTIADLLDRRLHAMGRHAIVLDGDNLRHGLTSDLGFSDADRSENIRRVSHVAALMADAGLIVIVSLISPFASDRERARHTIGPERFMEVFVDAPLDVCRQRDPKGMYARATSGALPRFTGIGAAYEPPDGPNLHLQTARISVKEATKRILNLLLYPDEPDPAHEALHPAYAGPREDDAGQ